MSVPNQLPFFPYLPDHSTWDEWNGNLAIFYSQEPIVFSPEINWQETARQTGLLPAFAQYPVPAPDTFGSWQDWAREFTLIINGQNT